MVIKCNCGNWHEGVVYWTYIEIEPIFKGYDIDTGHNIYDDEEFSIIIRLMLNNTNDGLDEDDFLHDHDVDWETPLVINKIGKTINKFRL